MTRSKQGVLRPASLRQGTAAMALGLSAAMIATPSLAQQAQQDEVELDTLKIEDRTADVNPYATPGAPYKAERSGDARRVKPLAETPSTITVITETQLEESGNSDLRAILDAQPGVTIGTGEGGNRFGDRYIIRGQEARSDVFIDGLRDPGLQSRESFAVDQIEITKGPSATFAGRGASGGAVNAISKQASTDYNFHNVDLTAGSENHMRATLDSNLKLSDSLAVRANLLYGKEEVPDRGAADRKRLGAALAVKADLSEKVSILADYYHLTAEDRPDMGQIIRNASAGGTPYSEIPGFAQEEDFLDTTVNSGTLRLKIDAWDGFRIENALRYGEVSNGYLVSELSVSTRATTDTVAPGASDFTISTKSGWQEVRYLADQLNLIGEFNTGSLKHNLVVGVEFSDNKVKNGGYTVTNNGATNCIVSGRGGTQGAYCIGDGSGGFIDDISTLVQRSYVRGDTPQSIWRIQTMSGYLMDSIDVTNWLNIAGGARFDSFDFGLSASDPRTSTTTVYNYNGTLWSYNASASVKPFEEVMAYFSWATGADINGGESDVGTNCGYGGLCSVTVDGVPVFQGKPERSDNLELGAKAELFDDKLLVTAALFQTTKKDIFEGGSNSYTSTGSLNSGKHRVRGVELGFAGNITDQLTGQVGVALMKSKILASAISTDNIGRRLANFANNSVDAQLRYQITDRLALGGNVTYQSEMFAGQPDTAAGWDSTAAAYSIRIPPHTVYGAFASYKVSDNFSLRLNALNLTDKQYYIAAYRSGKFAYLGDGRTVRLTLSGKF